MSVAPTAAPSRLRAPARRGRWIGRRIARDPLALVSWVVLALILLTAIIGPVFVQDPIRQGGSPLLPLGSSGHPLGTDDLGRDSLARLVHGAGPLLVVAIGATAIAAAIGVTTGLIAGFIGGRVDSIIMRIVDIAVAFPSVLLIVLLVAGLGSGLPSLLWGVGLALAPGMARLARALCAREANRDYVAAARLGASPAGRIIFVDILPNMAGPVLAQSVMTLSTAAGFAAGMSYIGLGIQPPTPDWGYMVAAGQEFIYNAPQLVALPALATLVFVVACNFIGDDLRDALDPRSAR